MTSIEFEQLLSFRPGGQPICIRDAIFDYYCSTLKDADRANAATKQFADYLFGRFVSSTVGQRNPCPGCDGHECDNGCAYPGAAQPPAAQVETNALLKLAGALAQLQLAEQSTTDEVTRRHLREIISWLSQEGMTS